MRDELSAVRAVRDRFVAADLANDAAAMAALLADDVVILHPEAGVISGRDAAARFMQAVLGEVEAEFIKEVRYTRLELHLSEQFAFERGEFTQALRPRAGGDPVHEHGQYLWLFTRNGDGVWRISRMAGAFVAEQPGEGC